MKKTVFFAMAAVVIASAFISCGKYKGFKKDDSGFYYKFYTQNDTALTPQDGDLALIDFKIRTDDSTLSKGMTHLLIGPDYSFYKGDLSDALKRMHTGDSATFIFQADTFAHYYLRDQYPEEKAEIYFDVKLHSIMTKAEIEEKEAEYNKQMEMARVNEEALLLQYLADNKITTKPTATGLYYMQTKAGKGKQAEAGKMVSVHYTGKLLDGTVFDTSISRGEPIEIPLGMGAVIPGWDEGIAMMKEGGKATLIIPSTLAYGARDNGIIPPFSTLVFDVELIAVSEMPTGNMPR